MDQMVDIHDTRASRGRTVNNGAPGASNVVLGAHDTLNGVLRVEGSIRVLGTVEGELSATGDIDLEPSAIVSARIEGKSINVLGTLTGDIVAHNRLAVGGSGTVTGDVRTPRLQVDDGATVNGNITMGAADKALTGEAAR